MSDSAVETAPSGAGDVVPLSRRVAVLSLLRLVVAVVVLVGFGTFRACSWWNSDDRPLAESYANVAQVAHDAISAYSADVRAGRQVKGGIPAS